MNWECYYCDNMDLNGNRILCEHLKGTKMTFDELKFKEEDGRPVLDNHVLKQCITIDDANRILAEKLERAPEITGTDFGYGDGVMWGGPTMVATHKARLVCIEEVSSNSSKKD